MIARRDGIEAEPRGDLLQAEPLLVTDGKIAYDPAVDAESFKARTSSTPTPPRAATRAASLISGGRLQNLPRGDFETPEPGGRPITAALVLHGAGGR